MRSARTGSLASVCSPKMESPSSCSITTTRWPRSGVKARSSSRPARLAGAPAADRRAGDLVRRRHLRAEPRREARRGGDRGARRLRARLRRRTARALPQGRGDATHGRAGRLDQRAGRRGLDGARAGARARDRRATGTPVAVTIGNDVSSRDIEGANPLYIPQAKIFAGACAIGPVLARPRRLRRAAPHRAAHHLALRRRALRRRDVDRAR